MRYTTNEEWRAAALALPMTLSAVDRDVDDGGLRIAIFALWRLLARAPTPIIQRYEDFDEAEIAKEAERLAARLGRDDFGYEISPREANEVIVFKTAAHLRALEERYTGFDPGERPTNAEEAWRIHHDGEDVYFIPRPRSAWRSAKTPDLRRFDQRGLLRVRIVPTAVDGARIRVIWPVRASNQTRSASFGAVLFPDLTFQFDQSESDFLIAAVAGAERDRVIDEACERMHTDDCSFAVFPELTIDATARSRIAQRLANKPWLDHGGALRRPPSAVVAGSWHKAAEGGTVNVATVLDGDGFELTRQRKRYAYHDDRGCRERIVPGEEITILVLEEGLAAVGLCLDFCNGAFDTIYGDLDVDFILVPSCGNDTTMAGHVRTASDLYDRRKARAFVVQQALPPIAGGFGYVLVPEKTPHQKTVEQLISKQTWRVYGNHGM